MIVVAAGCRKEGETKKQQAPSDAPAWFTEASGAAGLAFRHSSGDNGRFLFPETVTSGACAFDYDDDGWMDLYVVQGGRLAADPDTAAHNVLFHNRRDGTFEDVTESSGTGHQGYGMGCTYGDYDNDGDPDLFVTNLGANVLYQNDGAGKFRDVTREAGLGDKQWGTSAAFADYNGDGLLDLFVVNYIAWTIDQETDCRSASNVRTHCAPNNYNAPTPDLLYRNNGDGTFADVSTQVRIHRTTGNGLGIACGDFDRDGRLDFYVANDGMPNRLWLNRGDHFEDEALLAGCALNLNGIAEAGMGVAAIDAEPDGDLDLFMVHIRVETNTFYRNHGGWFEDVTATTGLAASSIGFTGFGLSFADFDNDINLDVFVANGGVAIGDLKLRDDDPYAEPNLLFRGTDDGKYEEVLPRGGTTPLLVETSRGVAAADFDNDGAVDLVIVNKDAPLHLLHNQAGARRKWIMFRVLNECGADAFGAELTAEVGDKRRHRILFPSYGYCSAGDPRLHFGLGTAHRVEKLTVRMPDGREKSLGPFEAGRVHVIRP